jgi:hypothetical protein
MITDYGSLQADLQKYLQDDDLTAEIPDFVQLCTERLNTDLEAFSLEKELSLDVTTGEAALPDDFGQILSIEMDVYPSPPRYTPPQAFHDYPRWDANTRQPVVFTIEAQKIKVQPTPDQTANAMIVYRNKLPLLVDDTDTNAILTNQSGLYLYGSLLAAEPRVGNDPRMATWATLYQERVDALNKDTRNDRFPRGNIKQTMSVRPSRLGRPQTAKPSS